MELDLKAALLDYLDGLPDVNPDDVFMTEEEWSHSWTRLIVEIEVAFNLQPIWCVRDSVEICRVKMPTASIAPVNRSATTF